MENSFNMPGNSEAQNFPITAEDNLSVFNCLYSPNYSYLDPPMQPHSSSYRSTTAPTTGFQQPSPIGPIRRERKIYFKKGVVFNKRPTTEEAMVAVNAFNEMLNNMLKWFPADILQVDVLYEDKSTGEFENAVAASNEAMRSSNATEVNIAGNRQSSFSTQMVPSHSRSIYKRSTILMHEELVGESSQSQVISNPHCFKKYNFTTPTYCDLCSHVLSGLVKTGMRCIDCEYNRDSVECPRIVQSTNR